MTALANLKRASTQTSTFISYALATIAISLVYAFVACEGTLIAPETAYAAAPIATVSDDEFAPEEYRWNFDFEDVEPVAGFQYVEDISAHYSKINIGDPERGVYDCVKRGDSGYAAYIEDNGEALDAEGNPLFALRFKDGRYENTPIDAVVSIVDWNYIEPSRGWNSYWMHYNVAHVFDDLRPGVFYNLGYTNDARNKHLFEQPSINNVNLYLVGLNSLTIEIEFFQAGTDTPVAIKGHATSIDLDCAQAMAFSGGFDRVEIAERSLRLSPEKEAFLSIDDETGRITAGTYAISATDDDGCYQCGLVGGYFNTEQEPMRLTFETPWEGYNNSLLGVKSTAISFFALTPEYVANPPLGDMAVIVKSIEPDEPVKLGDTVCFQVDVTMPVEGVTCRVGYRYKSYSFIDVMNPCLKLSFDDCSLYRIDGAERERLFGLTLSAAGTGRIEHDLAESYLESQPMVGQTLRYTFHAQVTDLPEPNEEGRYFIPNQAVVTINGTQLHSNTVYVEVDHSTPKDVTIAKRIRADSLYAGHGNPAFLFELSGTDKNGVERTYRRLAAFIEDMQPDEEGMLCASFVIEAVPEGLYTLIERSGIRYRPSIIESNGMVEDGTVVLDLSRLSNPEATFTNEKATNDGGSDSTSVINRFTAS